MYIGCGIINITKDRETYWIFGAYFIINALAILNNYIDGVLAL